MYRRHAAALRSLRGCTKLNPGLTFVRNGLDRLDSRRLSVLGCALRCRASPKWLLHDRAQAARAGYSPQLLAKYLGNGRVVRVRRGIYRLVHFPASEHEDLVRLWLWAEQAGVFSHETALALHDLSDVLPAKVHMTTPANWQRRRLRVPAGLVLHYADIPDVERTWLSAVPVTTPTRTLRDCIAANVSPELVRQAVLQAADAVSSPSRTAPRFMWHPKVVPRDHLEGAGCHLVD